MIGRTYGIIDYQSDLGYVGSTGSELRVRWQRYKQVYKKWTEGKFGEVSIYPLIQQLGIERFKVILIKKYDVFDKTHLGAYEQLWINRLNCVNKVNPFYIPRLSNKTRYENNKEARLQTMRKWSVENRDIKRAQQNQKCICECGREYTQANKSRHLRSKIHLEYIKT
ncbi:unnamed protein product [Phytophthora lilii]|uniref:Unnamed protein product n=1 Tax=Phytophthora lilii TaxID=2077276 RepID=A0A9W6TUZ3_9STRA|nr:unnamed protein product [Phytophthora lilii]